MVRVLSVVLPEPRVAGWSVLLYFFYAQPSFSSSVMHQVFLSLFLFMKRRQHSKHNATKSIKFLLPINGGSKVFFVGPTAIKIAVF